MTNATTPVARHGKMVAKTGRGGEVAKILLDAAAALEDDPGCMLYLINHQTDAPDTIWVTELWRSQADLDRVVTEIRDSESVAAVMALIEAGENIELTLLGGKGVGGAGAVAGGSSGAAGGTVAGASSGARGGTVAGASSGARGGTVAGGGAA